LRVAINTIEAAAAVDREASVLEHRCKKRFYYVSQRFLFSKRFFILINDGKVQSGKQISKKHFQNNSATK